MGEGEVIMTITIFRQDDTYWTEIEEMPGFSAVDENLARLLRRVAAAWEEMGGWNDEPSRA